MSVVCHKRVVARARCLIRSSATVGRCPAERFARIEVVFSLTVKSQRHACLDAFRICSLALRAPLNLNLSTLWEAPSHARSGLGDAKQVRSAREV